MCDVVRSRVSRRQLMQGAAAAFGASLAGGLSSELASGKAPMMQAQAPAFYRFKVGAYEATAVSDGPLRIGPPSSDVFLGLSKEAMTKALASHFLSTDNVELEQNALVINTGNTVVLFDTGLGSSKLLGADTGRLIGSLKAAGFDPKDIDAIALTHAHPDHCWALMGDDAVRNFPNAQIYMARADFDFWTDEAKLGNEKLKAFIEGTRKQLLPNRDRMVFVKEGQEIIPGIQAFAAPGHTVGHTIYLITSDGQSICNVGDIAHHHVLVPENPRLEFAFDTDGKQAVASRLRVFDMLATTGTQCIAYHFPWPGIGHIGRQADAYRYFPTPMRMVP